VLTGSFGTYPTELKAVLRELQDRAEAKPDDFIRYERPRRLDQSRVATARFINAPVEACVFVPNTTTGINIVLRNLRYKPGDVIIYFATIYGACEKSVRYVTETTDAEYAAVKYTYPVSDDSLCHGFETVIKDLRSKGKTPKIAVFDTIVSLPGVRMPFERLTRICKQQNILSCIDGAHGISHIPLNLTELDPDFFVSNCHKWLLVPRGCAIFYVPERHHHLIRSTLPTSHGFVPEPDEYGNVINNPLPPTGKSEFVTNFEFVGTVDDAPYLCVEAALEWRGKLQWHDKTGEDAATAYCNHLAKRSGEIIRDILGTEVLENDEGTLGNCYFSNVRLPLDAAELTGGDAAKRNAIGQWILNTLLEEYDTFIAIIFYAGSWWVRQSAQVYLTEADFTWAGDTLKKICERARESWSSKR